MLLLSVVTLVRRALILWLLLFRLCCFLLGSVLQRPWLGQRIDCSLGGYPSGGSLGVIVVGTWAVYVMLDDDGIWTGE